MRSEDEKKRARNHLATARSVLDAVANALDSEEPPGSSLTQTVMLAALNLATSITRIDAYQRTEADRVSRPPDAETLDG